MPDHKDQPDADLAAVLDAWHAPPARPDAIERTVQAVHAEMAAQQQPRQRIRWGYLILRSQVSVVRREIWWTSVLVLGIGVWLSAAMGDDLILRLFAPVIAAWGIAFLYDEQVERVFELERAAPIPAALLMLARLTLVFGFNLALGLAATGIGAWALPGITFRVLLTGWLAPMTFLSGLAFFLSVLSRDAVFGGMTGMTLWVVYHLVQAEVPLVRLPDLTTPFAQIMLVTVAGVLALSALLVLDSRLGWRAAAQQGSNR